MVNGLFAGNSVVVDRDRVEAFVFETLIVSFKSAERWHQCLGEKAPEGDTKIHALEVQLSSLSERQSRVSDLCVTGEVDGLQHAGHVQWSRDEVTALQAPAVAGA